MNNPYAYEGPGLHDVLGLMQAKAQMDQAQFARQRAMEQDTADEADRAFKNRLAHDAAGRALAEHKLTMQAKKLDVDNATQAIKQHAYDVAMKYGSDAGSQLLESHFGEGHGLADTGQGILRHYEPGNGDKNAGGTFIDMQRQGADARRYADVMTPRTPGQQAAELPMPRVDVLAARLAMGGGSPPQSPPLTAAQSDTSLFEGGPGYMPASPNYSPEIYDMMTAARHAPQLSPDQESIQRAVGTLVTPAQHVDDMRQKVVAEETMRHHMMLEAQMRRARSGSGGGVSPRVIKEVDAVLQANANERQREHDATTETRDVIVKAGKLNPYTNKVVDTDTTIKVTTEKPGTDPTRKAAAEKKRKVRELGAINRLPVEMRGAYLDAYQSDGGAAPPAPPRLDTPEARDARLKALLGK